MTKDEALRIALAAMNAMLTEMGMDEDAWNKITFEQMRKAITVAQEALQSNEQEFDNFGLPMAKNFPTMSKVMQPKQSNEQVEPGLKPRCFADFQPNREYDHKCQWCADAAERKTGMVQNKEPEQELPRTQQFCFCHNGISLQMVSGGAAEEGYLGRITLKIDGEYIDYVKAQPKEPEQEPVKLREVNKRLSNHIVEANKMVAQPEQEPVGLIESLKDAKPCCGEYETCWRACTPRGKFLGQRDAQRTWVGLSREDCYQVRERESDAFMYGVAWAEAKLKEKNT